MLHTSWTTWYTQEIHLCNEILIIQTGRLRHCWRYRAFTNLDFNTRLQLGAIYLRPNWRRRSVTYVFSRCAIHLKYSWPWVITCDLYCCESIVVRLGCSEVKRACQRQHFYICFLLFSHFWLCCFFVSIFLVVKLLGNCLALTSLVVIFKQTPV